MHHNHNHDHGHDHNHSKVLQWQPPPSGERPLCINSVPGADEILKSQGLYCPVCYTVTKDLAVLCAERRPEAKEDYGFVWDIILDEILQSIDNGCQFCILIGSRFLNHRFLFMFGNGAMKNDTGCCAYGKHKITDDHKNKLLKISEEHPEARIRVICEPYKNENANSPSNKARFTLLKWTLPGKVIQSMLGHDLSFVAEFYAKSDNPAASFIKTRPVNTNPASEESLQWAKDQIEECLEKHQNCPNKLIPQLPKRVVQIIDDEHLSLVSKEEQGLYTALSYCWGGPQTFSTTLETISQYSEIFKTSELPQTLQDAVTLTRRLGIDKIWIDSLCIIQDSPEDKDQEMAKMSQYYSKAFVTICAGGENCNDGFLKTRDECEDHPGFGVPRDVLTMPYIGLDDKIGQVYFQEEKQYCPSWEPVNKRAWTLQERLLSPRVLIYGTRLLWQCNTIQRSDGGTEDWSFDLRSCNRLPLSKQEATKMEEPSLQEEETQSLVSTSKDNKVKDILHIWHTVVHEYTGRIHSFPNDKFPAISGIATELAKNFQDKYLAGLWESQLRRELMWSTFPNAGVIKPEKWRAPTWSWASVENKISFDRLPHPDADPMIEILDCIVTAKVADAPFGELQDAVLKVKGPLIDVPVDNIAEMVKKENTPVMKPGMCVFESSFHDMLNLAHHDHGDKEWIRPDNASVLLMFLHGEKLATPENGMVYKDDEGIASCLILTKRPDGKYERVASLSSLTFSGVSNVSMTEIEIV